MFLEPENFSRSEMAIPSGLEVSTPLSLAATAAYAGVGSTSMTSSPTLGASIAAA